MFEKKMVLCDIDGTLTIIGDRGRHAIKTPPDWEAFHGEWKNDKEEWRTINLIHKIKDKYKIVFCTGRPDLYRAETVYWLSYVGFHYFEYILLMRPRKNTMMDTKLKPYLLRINGIYKEDISFIFEDRRQMVDEWRRLGYLCFQVNEGLT